MLTISDALTTVDVSLTNPFERNPSDPPGRVLLALRGEDGRAMNEFLTADEARALSALLLIAAGELDLFGWAELS